jgi:DNA-binding HxlR family transcriptional regulator
MAGIDPELLFLAASRRAVGVLDALSEGPRQGVELRKCAGCGKHAFAGTLRTLAAFGVIRRIGGHGSWDEPESGVYALTTTGCELADGLGDLETWTAIYEAYLHGC